MRRISHAAVIMLFCLVNGFCSGSKPAEESREEWSVYEDSRLRFEYPKTWKASFEERPAEDTRWNWKVDDPDADMGTIHIWGYREGAKKQPLENIYSSEDWRPEIVVRKPQRFQLKDAECLDFKTEGA